jgi:hypothetical protein
MEPSSRTDTRNGTLGTLRKKYVVEIVCLVGLVIISFGSNKDNILTLTLPVESIKPASAFEMAVANSFTSIDDDEIPANENPVLIDPVPAEYLDLSSTSIDNISTNTTQTANLSSNIHTSPSYEWVQNCTRRITQKGLIPLKVTWEGYRLGDCIKTCNPCKGPRSDTMAVQYGNLYCNTRKGTPRELRLQMMALKGGNLTAVEEIFQLHKHDPSFRVPAADELVIHLRLGDVIERSQAKVEQMLMNGADPKHANSFKTAIKSIHEYLADIQKSGLHKVVIRGGSHQKKYYQKSRVYAGCLKEAIENAGYHVSMEVEGNTPDQDFYYMSHATKVVVSTGGYSRLIGRMVKKGGGIIVGRTF